MSTSNAISGFGTIFKRSITSSGSGAYTAITEVVGISGPNKTRDTAEVTTMTSDAAYKEFIGTLRDGGEITINLNWTRDGYIIFNTDLESDTKVKYKMILSDTEATEIDVLALVTGLDMGTPIDDKATMDVTIKVSGQPTLTS